MKNLLDKIGKKYKKNLPEIILMCLFVCAALALNASQIARDTEAVFGHSINRPATTDKVAQTTGLSGLEDTASNSGDEKSDSVKDAADTDDEKSGSAEDAAKDSGDGKSGSGKDTAKDSDDGKSGSDEDSAKDSGDGKSGSGKDAADTDDEKSGSDKDATDDSADEAKSGSGKNSTGDSADDGKSGSGAITVDTSDRSSAPFRLRTIWDTVYLELPAYLVRPGSVEVSSRVRPAGDAAVLAESAGTEDAALIESAASTDVAAGEYTLIVSSPPAPSPALAEYKLAAGSTLPDDAARPSLRNFALLKRMLENRLSSYDGDWSVYVKNLSTNEQLLINDQPMKSASVMKLFIMGTVYKAFESGELARTDEVMSLMSSMISVSDNEASNQLLYLLGDSSYEAGIAQVDAFIQEYGFSDMTVEYNGFNNSATVTDSNSFNQVAAKDCGKLLEDIYRRSWVSRDVSNEIEEMLLNQHTRYKIPAGLPEGVLCGNKTGEMDTTENDAAIIYAEDCDYILVVLSSDWNSKDEAISRIASLSSLVYNFLSGD